MSNLDNFGSTKDEISELIDEVHDDLMVLRLEYMSLKKRKEKNIEKMEKLASDIVSVNEDFESLVKTHTLYLRYKKVSGQSKPNHSSEILNRIKELKTNVGQIVSAIPSTYKSE
jgi:hypothetical protein